MKTLLVFFLFGTAAICAVIDEIVTQQSEFATNYPAGVMDGDISLVPEEEETKSLLQERQNNVQFDYDDEEGVDVDEAAVNLETIETETTTVHWSKQGCTKANEEWNACGPRCQLECLYQPEISGNKNSRAMCESIFKGSCIPGCFCKSGYVRFNDECVLPKECPTRACLLNEEYKLDGTVCEISCDNYEFLAEIEDRCPRDIQVKGCFCKSGYVRSWNRACILPNRCPRHKTS